MLFNLKTIFALNRYQKGGTATNIFRRRVKSKDDLVKFFNKEYLLKKRGDSLKWMDATLFTTYVISKGMGDSLKWIDATLFTTYVVSKGI